tara:strand:+ start:17987 stop:18952 length:966 start_codon:yes stop_codon:yes gene_type:complete
MINSIQYLRGIAALLVVWYHSTIKATQNDLPNAEVFYFGQSGVDLFFIISGFIICFVTDKKKFTCFNFLKGRVSRIIPLYWFFTLIALVAFIMVPHLVNSSGGETLILHSFFLLPTEQKYLIQNGWTLSYEFYFYLICTVILFFNLNKTWLLLTLITLPIVGQLFDIYFFFDKFLIEFAMGVFSYVLYSRKALLRKHIYFLTCIISGWLLLTLFDYDTYRTVKYGLLMWFLFHLGLLINHKLDVDSKIGKLLNEIGNSSYALYLSHTFSLVVLNKVYLYFFGNNSTIFYLLLLTSISVVIGYFVFKYIETPLNHITKKILN